MIFLQYIWKIKKKVYLCIPNFINRASRLDVPQKQATLSFYSYYSRKKMNYFYYIYIVYIYSVMLFENTFLY